MGEGGEAQGCSCIIKPTPGVLLRIKTFFAQQGFTVTHLLAHNSSVACMRFSFLSTSYNSYLI